MLEFNSVTASPSLSFVCLLLIWELLGVPEVGMFLSFAVDVDVGENSLCERLGQPFNLPPVIFRCWPKALLIK